MMACCAQVAITSILSHPYMKLAIDACLNMNTQEKSTLNTSGITELDVGFQASRQG